jgi:hypothetical protein
MEFGNLNIDLCLSLLVFTVVFVSSFIHSSVGFGFSILTMTILPMFVSLIPSAMIVKASMLVTTTVMAIKLYKHINFRFIILPTIFLMIGNTIGFYLLMNLRTEVLKVILGIVLVGLGLFNVLFKKTFKIKKSVFADIFFGLLAGIIGGLFNLAGVVLVIYFFNVIEDKLEYAASMQAAFSITATYGVILHVANGNFTDPKIVYLTGLSIITVLLGSYLGLKVLRKISKEVIGIVSYVYMIVMGFLMIFKIG